MQDTVKGHLDALLILLQTRGVDIGLNLLGAITIWILGRWGIRATQRAVKATLDRRKTDPTLARYAQSVVSITLTIALLVIVLGFFGIETTSFAALIAAGGVAIGMAWSGLLSNFAAGVFLLILKPFKVGESIAAGGVSGTVLELGLFATTFETADGIVVFVGNNKLLSENIQNMSSARHRRVDLIAQLAHGADVADARRRLLERLATIPHVLTTPAPIVEILEFNAMGTVLAVRPFTENLHYGDVFFATNAAISEIFGAAKYPAPFTVQRGIGEHAA
ncbi:MAG TPA: mechanosensitive ion channel family protein [Kofleriaceae bacterium]|jgi:small conductance mechanosensitive channel|nr:mechanosensitive ion channel family protein [Kofleriaceae bacterium]